MKGGGCEGENEQGEYLRSFHELRVYFCNLNVYANNLRLVNKKFALTAGFSFLVFVRLIFECLGCLNEGIAQGNGGFDDAAAFCHSDLAVGGACYRAFFIDP
jgi:hypothetical protein